MPTTWSKEEKSFKPGQIALGNELLLQSYQRMVKTITVLSVSIEDWKFPSIKRPLFQKRNLGRKMFRKRRIEIEEEGEVEERRASSSRSK